MNDSSNHQSCLNAQRQLMREVDSKMTYNSFHRPQSLKHEDYVYFLRAHAEMLFKVIGADTDKPGCIGEDFAKQLFDKGVTSLQILANQTAEYFPLCNGGAPQFRDLSDQIRGLTWDVERPDDQRDGIISRRRLILQDWLVLCNDSLPIRKRIERILRFPDLMEYREVHADANLGMEGTWNVRSAEIDRTKTNGNWKAEMYLYVAQFIMGMAQCLSKRYGRCGIMIWFQVVPETAHGSM